MTRHRSRAHALLSPAIVIALALGGACVLAPSAGATPPSPPLEFEVRALEPPAPGRPTPFVVEVTPLVAGEVLRLRVVLPADCALTRGDTLRVEAAPAAGQTARFEYAISCPPGLRRYIYVRAELLTATGRRITRGQNLVLLAGPPLVPDELPRISPAGAGQSGLSYDGAPVPTRGRPSGPKPPGIAR